MAKHFEQASCDSGFSVSQFVAVMCTADSVISIVKLSLVMQRALKYTNERKHSSYFAITHCLSVSSEEWYPQQGEGGFVCVVSVPSSWSEGASSKK